MATPVSSGDDGAPGRRGLRIRRSSPDANAGTGVFVGLVVLLALVPLRSDGDWRRTLTEILIYLSLAQMWNLLAGFAGLVSIGQQAFVGVGGYTVFYLSEQNGLDPFVAIVLAGVFCAVLSVPVAALAFRLRGGYFAIGTWVIAEVFRLVALKIGVLEAGNVRSFTRNGALSGYSIGTFSNAVFYGALLLGVGATVVVVLVLRSRLGLGLQAVRDSEDGARGVGIDVTRTRLAVWVIAAGWTGATGGLIFLNALTITSADAFSVLLWTALVIFIVIIGGVGSVPGPIIGVVLYWFVADELTSWLGWSDTWRFIVLGALAIVFAVWAPRGVFGLLQRWLPWQIFPTRRRLEGLGDAGQAPSPAVGDRGPS